MCEFFQSHADLISLYVFGEDEETLAKDVKGGIIQYDKVAKHVESNPKVRTTPTCPHSRHQLVALLLFAF